MYTLFSLLYLLFLTKSWALCPGSDNFREGGEVLDAREPAREGRIYLVANALSSRRVKSRQAVLRLSVRGVRGVRDLLKL